MGRAKTTGNPPANTGISGRSEFQCCAAAPDPKPLPILNPTLSSCPPQAPAPPSPAQGCAEHPQPSSKGRNEQGKAQTQFFLQIPAGARAGRCCKGTALRPRALFYFHSPSVKPKAKEKAQQRQMGTSPDLGYSQPAPLRFSPAEVVEREKGLCTKAGCGANTSHRAPPVLGLLFS